MRVLDLFSGIGGISLGLENAGMCTQAFCEIEPYCQNILKKHWPKIPIYKDIRTLNGKTFKGKIDLVCGGYPCQPFSCAGKRKGENDSRHLWPEMFRVIQESKPSWVIAENVRGHVFNGFDTVAAQLESEGFTVWPFLIPACAVGSPQKRERVWIISYSASQGLLSAAQAGIHCRKTIPRPRHEQSQRFSKWHPEPGVARVADGIPYRVDRIKALGNSAIPQIAELIGITILEYLKRGED